MDLRDSNNPVPLPVKVEVLLKLPCCDPPVLYFEYSPVAASAAFVRRALHMPLKGGKCF